MKRRRTRLWALVPVALLIFCVAWIGVRALLAKDALEAAQPLVSQLKSEAVSFDIHGAQADYKTLSSKAATAKSLTSDPIWRAAEFVPLLGRNLAVVRQLADVTDGVVDAMGPLVDMMSSLNPKALKPKDGAIPLQPFVDAAPVVKTATSRLTALKSEADRIDASGTVGQVRAARDKLVSLLDHSTPALTRADELVPLIPDLLGANGPRTYVVMFQNNAELRSLGGTALSFAVVSLDHGKIQLVKTVPAGFANFQNYTDPVIPVPDGFEQIYAGQFGRFIPNATMRPSFESAAEIVQANWQRQFGANIDGVVSLDAVALSYVVAATGPIPLATGDTIDSSSVVPLLLNGVYSRYNTKNPVKDNEDQDAVYSDAVSKTFAKLSTGGFDPAKLASGLIAATTEQRFYFWDSRPTEQATISKAQVFDETLPPNDSATDGVGIYTNDYVGSKLNFYLHSSLTTSAKACTPDHRLVRRFTLQLSSSLTPVDAASLSSSIAGTQYIGFGLQKGAQRLMLFFYAPPGATVLSATVDGQAAEVTPLHDTDRPVEKVVVTVAPGGSNSVVVDMLMAPGSRALGLHVTPTVNGTTMTTAPLDCSTVTLPK